MRRVIVLRPEPGASATVLRARALGLDAIALPLFAVESMAWDAPDPAAFDALLLTSANAIRHGGERLARLRRLPVHAVGEATAEAARQAGFEVAGRGGGGVDGLLASIEPHLNLLHLCGEDRKPPEDARQHVTAITVYRSRQLEGASVRAAAGGIALVHSPRAGRRFAELADQAGIDKASIAIVAISEAAAEAVGPGWQAVATAESPSDDALLALAARLCNTVTGT